MKDKDAKSTYPIKQVAQAVSGTIILIITISVWLHNQSVEGYKSTIESKNATIQTIKEDEKSLIRRLEGKDEQLSEYRKRLGIIEENQTSYSILSNKELKERALTIVTKIRKSISYYRNRNDELLYADDRTKNWNKYNRKFSKLTNDLMNEYNNEFKIEAILIRDEILSRLSKKLKSGRDKYLFSSYERPTNPIGLEAVVDDLEKISKILID